jgi:PAS domain S-box-containing protein
MTIKNNVTRMISWLVAIVTGTITIAFPLGFLFFSYQYMLGKLETEVEICADTFTHMVSLNPDFWEFEYVRLKEQLHHCPKNEVAEIRRIVNNKNRIVAESADDLRPPLIMRSSHIMDSGVVVGRVEICRSLRPLLKKTGLIFLWALPMGAGVFWVLRVLPIKFISLAETALLKSNEELEMSNKLLHREIVKSNKYEAELCELNRALEKRVAERTRQLNATNKNLETQIADRKQAEAFLRKTALSLAEAQRIAHIGNWEWDMENDEMYWSDEICRITGTSYGASGGNSITAMNFVHPADRKKVADAVEKVIHEEKNSEIEHRIVRSDGSVREVAQRVGPVLNGARKTVKVIGITRDVTERNQAERDLQKAREQLLQAERLASIGRLSAGVAHEILNPVNIISMELQMLQTVERLPPEVLEELNICKDQIKRIVAIAENLKQISRVNNQKMVIADINNVIAQIMSLYATQFKIEEIEVEVHYQAHLPETMMDKEKISQVLQNLISNAMVSMEGIKNKRLKITTEEDLLIGHHDRLKIMVADTGVGIEEEYMSHIFDPFFTTKEQGKGTGLGLSISYGIIKEHGGKIWAENNEWGGASFFIELPVRID